VCLREPAAAPGDGSAGLLLASTGMAPSTVILHPPLVITPEEVDVMVGLLDAALSRLEDRS
jgi:4-aminobutyrate aminotransferase-like enzyme